MPEREAPGASEGERTVPLGPSEVATIAAMAARARAPLGREVDREAFRDLARVDEARLRPAFDAWWDYLGAYLPDRRAALGPMKEGTWRHVQQLARFLDEGDLEGHLGEWAVVGQEFHDAGLPLEALITTDHLWRRAIVGDAPARLGNAAGLDHALEAMARLAEGRMMLWSKRYTGALDGRIRELETQVGKLEARVEPPKAKAGGQDFDGYYFQAFERVVGQPTARVLRAMLLARTRDDPGPEWHRVHRQLEAILGTQARAVLTLAEKIQGRGGAPG